MLQNRTGFALSLEFRPKNVSLFAVFVQRFEGVELPAAIFGAFGQEDKPGAAFAKLLEQMIAVKTHARFHGLILPEHALGSPFSLLREHGKNSKEKHCAQAGQEKAPIPDEIDQGRQ